MNVLSGLLRAAFVVLAVAALSLALLLHSAEEHAPPRSMAETEPCPAPEGWSAHLVQVGENLTIIADIVGVAPAELVFANCLEGDLHPGDTVFLPPPSYQARDCGPPEDWVLYAIQPGDSLPILAQQYDVAQELLWHANCMSEDMTFQPGFRIYIPPSEDAP